MIIRDYQPAVTAITSIASESWRRLVFQENYEETVKNGYAKIPMLWRDDLILSKKRFDDIRDSNPMNSLSKYKGAILAIYGIEDDLVPYIYAKEIISACKGKICEHRIIDNANHTFNVLEKDKSTADKVVKDTADWIAINFKERNL